MLTKEASKLKALGTALKWLKPSTSAKYVGRGLNAVADSGPIQRLINNPNARNGIRALSGIGEAVNKGARQYGGIGGWAGGIGSLVRDQMGMVSNPEDYENYGLGSAALSALKGAFLGRYTGAALGGLTRGAGAYRRNLFRLRQGHNDHLVNNGVNAARSAGSGAAQNRSFYQEFPAEQPMVRGTPAPINPKEPLTHTYNESPAVWPTNVSTIARGNLHNSLDDYAVPGEFLGGMSMSQWRGRGRAHRSPANLSFSAANPVHQTGNWRGGWEF